MSEPVYLTQSEIIAAGAIAEFLAKLDPTHPIVIDGSQRDLIVKALRIAAVALRHN